MSSHDCMIRGSMSVVSGTDHVALQEVLRDFLVNVGWQFDELLSDGSIELHGETLSIDVKFDGYGGADNEEVMSLATALSAIAVGPSFLELVDFDTGDSDNHCCAYFVGRTDEELRRARVNYGFDQMTEWIEHMVSPERLIELKRLVVAEAGPGPEVAFTGNFSCGEADLAVQFITPADPSGMMVDAAFLAALAQQASISVQRTDAPVIQAK